MKSALLFLTIIFSTFSFAQAQLLNGTDLSSSSLEAVNTSLTPGSILIIGELHDNQMHHNNQFDTISYLLKNSSAKGVHLGMEFLDFTEQWQIYQYLEGNSTEEDFLKAVKWSDPDSYKFYSPSIDLMKESGGNVIGLNAPREITSKVAKNGIESLDVRELSLLPSPLVFGNGLYFERFFNAVGGHHVPEDKLKNYFWAQSIWDDTMSDTAIKFIEKNPQDILVIYVGDFHVAYGGGLKEVIQRKGFDKVFSISQVYAETKKEALQQASPHKDYGLRGDWVWISMPTPALNKTKKDLN